MWDDRMTHILHVLLALFVLFTSACASTGSAPPQSHGTATTLLALTVPDTPPTDLILAAEMAGGVALTPNVRDRLMVRVLGQLRTSPAITTAYQTLDFQRGPLPDNAILARLLFTTYDEGNTVGRALLGPMYTGGHILIQATLTLEQNKKVLGQYAIEKRFGLGSVYLTVGIQDHEIEEGFASTVADTLVKATEVIVRSRPR